jgi:alkylhydroperoxidase/carboxymuconolactone decarboxylase family protein YurZ
MGDRDEGMKTRRNVLGDEHVDRAIARAGGFGEPFQELITKYAWGGVVAARARPADAQRDHPHRPGLPAR